MDDYTGSVPVTSTSDSSGENLNSAPPQLPPESEIKNKNDTPKQETPYYTEQNYTNYNYNYQEENYDEIERPIIKHYYELGTLRKIIQYIFIILLFGCFVWGITIQFSYGISLALIDDVAILSVALIMLYLTLKNRVSAGKKLGGYTLAVVFFGFGIRGVAPFFQSKGTGMQVGLLIARTLILMFCTSLNCNG